MSIKIYGSGDDIIVIEGMEGVLPTEFTVEEETQYLSLSDGTVVKFTFDDAVWHIDVIEQGSVEYSITPATYREDIESDLFETDESVDWVTFGSNFVRAKET